MLEMLEISLPKNLLLLMIIRNSLGIIIRKTTLLSNKVSLQIHFIKQQNISVPYQILVTIQLNKIKQMSSEKLPKMTSIYKNTLQKKQISHNMQSHRKRLYQLQASKSKFLTVDHTNPNLTYRQLFEENPKKNYLLQNKYLQIERENRMLFQKIQKVHKSKKPKNKSSPSRSLERIKSLNITMRKKQVQQIQLQNAKMFDRIQRQKASISFRETDKQYNKMRRMSHQKLSNIQKNRLENWY